MRISVKLGLGLLLAIGLAGAGVGACKETTPGAAKSSDAKPAAGDTKVAATTPPAPASQPAGESPKPIAEAPKPAPVTAPTAPAPKPVAETPKPEPAPVPPAPKPVAEAPKPDPAPTPAAPPAPKPAAEAPKPEPTPPPVTEAPKPQPMPSPSEPVSKPVADAPKPEPMPAPMPAPPAPSDAAPPPTPPVAEAPKPQPMPSPSEPVSKPAAEAPAPAPQPETKPVTEAPAPAPEPQPAPTPQPEPKPIADTPPSPTPAPGPTPVPPPKGKYQAKFNGRPIKTWAIQLQNPDPDTIARTPYDVVTIDYSRDASAAGAFSKADVAKMKRKPDGSERVLIAYMSIGEIEDYRYYWQENGWTKKAKRPSWIGAENPEWLHNYTVKFWNQGWKDIIYAKPNSYLDKIIDAGFDGVYLDKIDITDVLEDDAPKGKSAFGLMVEFVQGIRAKADQRKPGFLMVASNAEAALDDDAYRATMNAIGKEDLYFNSQFNSKTGKLIDGFPNDPDAIKEQIRLLQKLIDDDKVVLSVEYIDNKPNLIPATAKKLADHGYVPYFGPRDLARLSGFNYAPTSLAASARKAAQCTGLAEDACRSDSGCIWLPGYKVDEATSVPGYCRFAPADTTPRLNVEARE